MLEIVIDTSVLIAGLRSPDAAARKILRQTLRKKYRPIFDDKLWFEYLAVTSRPDILTASKQAQTRAVLDGLASIGRWVEIHYDWRANLHDESGNHLIELALAAGSAVIVTHNIRDSQNAELHFQSLHVCTPAALTAHEIHEDFRSAARRGDPDKALAALDSLTDAETNPTV